jgi:hypothetical protein
MAQNGNVKLVFEGGFSERDQFEARARGYRSHVVAQFVSGEQYPLVFYDPVRLKQDLEDEGNGHTPVIAEPGLVVIPEVTLEMMEGATQRLVDEGFFDALKPIGPRQRVHSEV